MGNFRIFWTLISIVVLVAEPSLQEDVMLGDLSSCGHDVKGKVYATTKKQIVIKGFHYDGKGPGTFFTAMKKGETKVHPNPTAENFVIIAHKGAPEPCDVVSWEKAINGDDIKLDLPDLVTEYATIGVYCHQFCNNFGHVKITADVSSLEDSDGDYATPPTCMPTKDKFKKDDGKGPDCTDEKNLKNPMMDACDKPKPRSGGDDGSKSGAAQFQPTILMSAGATVFFGLISQYPLK